MVFIVLKFYFYFQLDNNKVIVDKIHIGALIFKMLSTLLSSFYSHMVLYRSAKNVYRKTKQQHLLTLIKKIYRLQAAVIRYPSWIFL